MSLKISEENAGKRLIDALHAEADRRSGLGHFAFAHELRSRASDISAAMWHLANSRTVREKP